MSKPECTAIGNICAGVVIATKSMSKFSAAMTLAAEAFRKASANMDSELEYIDRNNWWQRDEGVPGYLADVNAKEWWQDGDDPPGFGVAA